MLQKFGWLPVLPALSEIGADPAPAIMFNQVLDFQHIISQIKMRNLFHKFDINVVRSPVVFLRRFSNISPFHSNSFSNLPKATPSLIPSLTFPSSARVTATALHNAPSCLSRVLKTMKHEITILWFAEKIFTWLQPLGCSLGPTPSSPPHPLRHLLPQGHVVSFVGAEDAWSKKVVGKQICLALDSTIDQPFGDGQLVLKTVTSNGYNLHPIPQRSDGKR